MPPVQRCASPLRCRFFIDSPVTMLAGAASTPPKRKQVGSVARDDVVGVSLERGRDHHVVVRIRLHNVNVIRQLLLEVSGHLAAVGRLPP